MFDFFGELKKLKKLEKLKTNVLVDHVACIAIVLYYFTTFTPLLLLGLMVND